MNAPPPGPPTLARRLRAAIELQLELHTIKASDRRRRRLTELRRLWHYSDWRERARRADLPAAAPVAIPRERGFVVLPGGRLDHVDELVASAAERARGVDPASLPETGPRVKWGLLDMASLTLDSPFVRFGTSPAVVGAITEYLGAVPVLWTADVWSSLARTVPRPPTDSEIFHCDWDATSHVKVFIHCSDVSEENGPLVVIDAETSARVRERLRYDYGKRVRVSDETMATLTRPEDHTPVTGPAGTVALVDTSRCFHYGSRVSANARPRVMAMFQYVLPSAFVLPLDYRERAPLRRLVTPSLPKYQRLVLGGT